MKSAIVIPAVIVLLLQAPASTAKEHFVAIHHPNASSDSNAGTKERPWISIQQAASIAVGGDVVTVSRGVYREQITFKNSGNGPSSIIVLQAARGEKVVVSALDELTGMVQVRDGVYEKNDWPVETQLVLVDRQISLQQIGESYFSKQGYLKKVGSDESDLFPGSFFHDSEKQTLRIYTPFGRNASSMLIEGAVRDYCLRVNDWTTVQGIQFIGANYSRRTRHPALACGSNSVIEDCTVEWSDSGGFATGGDNVTIRGSKFNSCGRDGITFQGSGHLLVNNVTSGNNWRQINPGYHAGGVKAAACTNSVVRNHVSSRNWGSGIWFDIDCKNIVIESSFCSENLVGIHYETSQLGKIRNNICVDNSRNIWSSVSSDVLIEHNTCVGGKEGIVLTGKNRGGGHSLEGNVVRLNLVAYCENSQLLMSAESAFFRNNKIFQNLYAGNGENVTLIQGGVGTIHELADWRNKTRYGQRSIQAEPSFKNMRAYDFSPTPSLGRFGADSDTVVWVASQLGGN
jgi:hypothetical protein